jgi:scyllo-inositol 2-dehydrogenase (NADP+)
MSTQPNITVAIVGLGRAGWGLHLEPIVKVPGFKITAVADPAEERREEAAQLTGCAKFENIDALLAGNDAQVVVVATPSSMHYSDAVKVLNAGRHCILEKPIAMNSCEANELVELAQKKNLKLFINHSYLHRPEIHHFREIIESNILGPIFEVRALWTGYARRWDWQTLKKNGGGQLNNTCPHVLTVVLPLLGAPVEHVHADLRNIKDAGDAEDHVHLVLRARNGTTADIVVTSAINYSGGPRWMICGRYGTLTSNGEVSTIKYYDPAKATPLEVLDTAAPGRRYLSETLPWEEKEIPVGPAPVKPFHENIYDVLAFNAEQVVTPESAAEVVRITELAYAQAR